MISVDVLNRQVIESSIGGRTCNVLKTTRLILKRGTLPKWAPKGIIRNAESWVLEETEMDLDPSKEGRCMKSWTRNLDHTTVMAVDEHNVFREVPGLTELSSMFKIESNLGFYILRNRIEKFGLHRVMTHIDSVSVLLPSSHAADFL